MLLLLLFLNFLVVWGKLDSGVPACKDGLVVFEAPEGYTLETWYPKEFPIDSWNRERTFKNVTLFPKNYKCKYQIKVPEGWIGRLYLTAKLSIKNSNDIRISGHIGDDYAAVSYAVDQPYQFTGKDGFVELDTGLGEVSFGFKVDWIQPCNGTIIIEPPQDDTFVTWLPKKFRARGGSHSEHVPLYPINYKCRYLIKVPTGHSVRVFFSVGHPVDHFPVQVTRQDGEIENVTSSTESPFDFVISDGIIDLDTGKSEKVRFGLKIEWVKPCSTPIHFNPPEGNSSLWYPHEYTMDRPPQTFPDQYRCHFHINVPKGWSARVMLTSAGSGHHASVTVLDYIGEEEYITSATNEHFYFTEKGGQIRLGTVTHHFRFGFKVDWMKNPPLSTDKIKVQESDNHPEMLKIKSASAVTAFSEYRVSLTTVAFRTAYDRSLLRSVIVYDGPHLKSRRIGNAYQLWRQNTQYVSSGDQMTIQFLTRDISSHHPMLLIHDYENTEEIVKFEGFTCLTGQDCGVFELDATNGPVALQSIYSGWHAEKDIVTNYESTDGEMDVHVGGAKKLKTNVGAFFTFSNSWYPNLGNRFPYIIQGPLKTYVLRNGTAKISITRNWDAFGKTEKFGRKGHVTSNYYSYLNDRQHAFEEISAPEGEKNARFTFKVGYADMNENSSLRILGSENGTDVYQKIFQTTSITNRQSMFEDQFIGDKLSIYFDGGRMPSKGAFVSFEVDKP